MTEDPITVSHLVARARRLAQRAPRPTEPPPRVWSEDELLGELRRSGVPDKYAEASWEQCRAKKALRAYVDGLEGFVEQGAGLLLLGPVGTGKSSAAGLICQEAVRRNIAVRWWYVPDVIPKMSDRQHGEYVIRKQIEAPILVWDDFGVQGFRDWQLGLLDRVVEGRYRKNRPMIVTTNLTKGALEDASIARMNDRWAERRYTATLSGESMRRTWHQTATEQK
jgi:DNA replication protein DnaC